MKLQEILKARGITDEQLKEVQEQDIPAAAESFQRIMDIYYLLKVTADMESAYWYNRVWWENDGDLLEVRRAKAVAASLAHSTPTILPYEKLVMNKTKHLRGAFPFPWVCASFFNSLAESLMEEAEAPAENEADSVSVVGAGGGNVTESYGEVISIAKKFGMRKEDIPVLVKVSKYWDGISVEDISTKYAKTLPGFEQFQNIMDSVLVMFDSFAIPQGREVMNYYMPLQYGFDGILELCDEKIAKTMGEAGGDGVLGMSRGYYYAAMKEIVKGLSQWCENYARKAEDLASREPDEAYKKNYLEIAQVMHNIAHKRPSTFREALQMTLCLHLGVVNEDPQSGQSIGRLGQVLQPFYEKDIADGTTTEEEVVELLELYRIKITCIECFASAGVSGGVLSGNTFNNLSLGGQNYDGLSAVTPLEYLIIEAGMRAQTPQPTLSILYDEKLPEDFLMKAAACTKLGMGYPAWMNNQVGMNFMLRQYGPEGMDLYDARAWCLGGCLESAPGCFLPLEYNGKVTMIPGGASPTCGTGIHFTGLPKVLELVLTNGVDKRTGKQVFPPHNKKLETFDELLDQWKEYLDISNRIVNKVNNIQMDVWRKYNMPAVNSLLKPDCFKKGQHIGNCGARYNACINAPKYGNADPYADQLLRDYHMYLLHYLPTLESFFGKPEYLCQISVSTHGPQGFITLATADGRLAGTTYSDGSVSAAPGTDKNGIYALFESATVYDHSQNQNAQMNLKLHPSSVQGVQGTRKLLELVRTYMRKGGFHVQFNVVSSDILKEAQKTPDQYRDLMVRVAGFTQYWCEIGKPIQDEVIYRTEYEEV